MIYKLIVGSRSLNKISKENMDKLIDYNPETDIIVVGACKYGIDKLVMDYYPNCEKFPADWFKYGKRAGFVRNEQMHKYIATKENRVCFAFWDGISKGTAHSFELAKKYKNEIVIYEVKGE